jgi:hypothetical protein
MAGSPLAIDLSPIDEEMVDDHASMLVMDLPPLFRAYLLSWCFPDADLYVGQLPPILPDRPFDWVERWSIEKMGQLFYRRNQRLVPFTHGPADCSDLCFDTYRPDHSGDYPIIKVWHGRLDAGTAEWTDLDCERAQVFADFSGYFDYLHDWLIYKTAAPGAMFEDWLRARGEDWATELLRRAMLNPVVEVIAEKFAALGPVLDERARRLWAAAEAHAIGRGGISRVSEATGLSRITIRSGLSELYPSSPLHGRGATAGRNRRPGGGRKPLIEHDPKLERALEILVDPVTRGDPMSPLRWTCKSAANLAAELQAQGHTASERSVNRMLRASGYSLQSNRKTIEGGDHPDRDAQFQHINRRVKAYQKQGQPVVSVDAKKKELIGRFRNGGREWEPSGEPEAVNVYDFIDKGLGKAIPYGVYDQTTNTGWVGVGIDHDTSEFAVETLRRWWRNMGRQVYPQAKKLLITADGGGSNGSRCRRWKMELQRLASETGLRITVCHFAPGTNKWNKIEHRMFSHITENWRGRPLVNREVVVNLIGSTTTDTGLSIRSELDDGNYPTGRKVTDEQMKGLMIRKESFTASGLHHPSET